MNFAACEMLQGVVLAPGVAHPHRTIDNQSPASSTTYWSNDAFRPQEPDASREGLLRQTAEGELVANEIPIMTINDGGQMSPPILPTGDMRHVYRLPFITPIRPTHPTAYAGSWC